VDPREGVFFVLMRRRGGVRGGFDEKGGTPGARERDGKKVSGGGFLR